MKKHNIIIVGAGSGGLNIAGFMNKAGFKVLLIDKSDKNIGGDCLNFGCVPSKALIHIARIIHNAKLSEEFGFSINGKLNMKKVIEYVKNKQRIIREHENASWFRKLGIDVELGEAEFVSKKEIKVNGKTYEGEKIVIATGSRPLMPLIKGIEKIKKIYTNETIFDLNYLPKKLAVIGAGPIGLELGQAFSRLGSDVTIIQRGSHFLPKEIPEISEILYKQLIEEGMKIHFDCEPISFLSQNSLEAKTKSGKIVNIAFDAVLLAVGRELNIPKGLKKAGVELTEDKRKINVNEYLQTANKNIYLCGDVAGGYQFTHAAELHASVILNNFFSPFKKKLSYDNFSWVTYTDPEIATFGLSEEELRKRDAKYKKLIQEFGDVDRGIVNNAKGKLIIYVSKNKRILGGTLISPNAGEIFQELSLAMSSKLKIKNIFGKIYPYPTASRINKKAITRLYADKLTGFSKKLLKLIYSLK
ncbi:FAD-dependent oxidoreductase [Candidatus Pacearchaeota archaeon]|nr:FAD-dependent oxidoreductase [Candidatus Pacearchaeota archaeon]